jgi:hypothetical protein
VPVPTGVVGDPGRAADVIGLRVPAQGGRPAGRDDPEGAVLPSGEPVGFPVRRPDEIRELDPARRAHRLGRRGRRRRLVQPLQRRGRRQDGPSGEANVIDIFRDDDR